MSSQIGRTPGQDTQRTGAPTSVRSSVKPSRFHSLIVLSADVVASWRTSGLSRHLSTYFPAGGHATRYLHRRVYQAASQELGMVAVRPFFALLDQPHATFFPS